MSSIFSRIISGEIPCYKVAENSEFLAFLDVNPLCKGHVLVVPKQETDYIFDMQDDALSKFHLFAKQVAIGLRRAVPCKKVGVAVIGLEVPHAHIHLVPMNHVGDLNFTAERVKLSPEEYAATAVEIAACIP